jgi:EAL domain-containing protein (putative c-di-GMP-specific phosphodiesterase class I)
MKTAEESGLIVFIGRWALTEACRQMKQWQDRFDPTTQLSISVNLSSRQLAQTGMVDDIKAILAETGLDPRSLRLELSEATMIKDIKTLISTVGQLQSLGIEMAIDDFGAGFSSIGYLSQLSVKTLKIDRTFIRELGGDKSCAAMITAIISNATTLGIKVIAEGIETESQRSDLIGMDCGFGQGFLFDRALDSSDAEELFMSEFAERGSSAQSQVASSDRFILP